MATPFVRRLFGASVLSIPLGGMLILSPFPRVDASLAAAPRAVLAPPELTLDVDWVDDDATLLKATIGGDSEHAGHWCDLAINILTNDSDYFATYGGGEEGGERDFLRDPETDPNLSQFGFLGYASDLRITVGSDRFEAFWLDKVLSDPGEDHVEQFFRPILRDSPFLKMTWEVPYYDWDQDTSTRWEGFLGADGGPPDLLGAEAIAQTVFLEKANGDDPSRDWDWSWFTETDSEWYDLRETLQLEFQAFAAVGDEIDSSAYDTTDTPNHKAGRLLGGSETARPNLSRSKVISLSGSGGPAGGEPKLVGLAGATTTNALMNVPRIQRGDFVTLFITAVTDQFYARIRWGNGWISLVQLTGSGPAQVSFQVQPVHPLGRATVIGLQSRYGTRALPLAEQFGFVVDP